MTDEAQAKFAPGDVVRLKSGGLPMTVRHVDKSGATCLWHDVDGVPQSWTYAESMLDGVTIERQGLQPLSEPMNSADTWRQERGLS